VPLLPDGRRGLPALRLHATDEPLKRGLRLRRWRYRSKARRAKRSGEHERRRLPVAVELLGNEPRLSPVADDRDQGTPAAHALTTKAHKLSLVPRSSRVDGPPLAGLEPRDKQLVGDSSRAPSAKSTEPRRSEGRRSGNGRAQTVSIGHNHLELAVATRFLVDDAAPIRPTSVRRGTRHVRRINFDRCRLPRGPRLPSAARSPGWRFTSRGFARASVVPKCLDELLLVHRGAARDACIPSLLVQLALRLRGGHGRRCLAVLGRHGEPLGGLRVRTPLSAIVLARRNILGDFSLHSLPMLVDRCNT
jgi:hypothetical protein